MLDLFDKAVRASSEEKRGRFAQIVANQLMARKDWEEAEQVVRLLAELSDIHIDVLRESLTAQVSGPPFEGLQLVSTAGREPLGEIKPMILPEVLPHRISCESPIL